MSQIRHLIYLHGFNSSAQSVKAQQAKQYFNQHFPELAFCCPQLLTQPRAAIAQIEEIISQLDGEWALIGSSLGGYFSSYFAEKYQKQAVLVNPAVKPYELLNNFLGEQVNPYTGERYLVESHFIADLKALEPKQVNEKQYFVLLQTADEVLDYTEAETRFAGSKMLVEQGGDHSFVGFDNKLPDIANFLQLT